MSEPAASEALSEVTYTQYWIEVIYTAGGGDRPTIYSLFEKAAQRFPHLPWLQAVRTMETNDKPFQRDLADLAISVLGRPVGDKE